MSTQEHERETLGPAGRTRNVDAPVGFASDLTLPVEVPVEAPAGLLDELRSLGRTEDIALAPNGRRIALAGFSEHLIGLIDVDVDVDVSVDVSPATPRAVRIGSVARIRSELLLSPHGVSFVDDEVLLVANRDGVLVAVRMPVSGQGGDVAAESWVVVDRSATVPVSRPGSVTVHSAGGGLCEAVVCDNDTHRLIRYVLDTERDLAVVDAEVLIDGLQIPDGVTVSASGEWLAVSNHESHEVFLYRYDLSLRGGTRQVGVLRGPNYPHGLSFVDDDRHLLVSDAGLPFVYVYSAPDGDWSGTRSPARVVRVMSDVVFNSGRYNPTEGGPKGLTLVPGAAMVAVTSEWQSLACFSVADLLGSSAGGQVATPNAASDADLTTRRIVLRAAARLSDAEQALAGSRLEHQWIGQALAHSHAESKARFDDLAASALEVEACRSDLVVAYAQVATSSAAAADLSRQVELLHTSMSWRVTAPLRRVGSVVRAFRRRR